MRYIFDELTRSERLTLGRIAINCDIGVSPRVAKNLEGMGLIVGTDEILAGHPPVTVRRYHVPIPVHMSWCEWCSARYKGDT